MMPIAVIGAVTGALPRAPPPIRARPTPIRTVSPAATPGSPQLGVDAEPREVALEALRRLLDVEVGLGGEALDPRARGRGTPRRSSRSTTNPSPMRLDAMDDDAGGLGRLGQLVRVGQQRRRARLGSASRPSPVGAEIATTVDALGGSGAAERRPCLGGGGQVDLVERDEHRLLEQRRVVRPELLADDVVVPLGVARRAVDDVDEHPRPLDVAQERVAEAGAAAGALDEAGHVGDRRAAVVARRRGP